MNNPPSIFQQTIPKWSIGTQILQENKVSITPLIKITKKRENKFNGKNNLTLQQNYITSSDDWSHMLWPKRNRKKWSCIIADLKFSLQRRSSIWSVRFLIIETIPEDLKHIVTGKPNKINRMQKFNWVAISSWSSDIAVNLKRGMHSRWSITIRSSHGCAKLTLLPVQTREIDI